MGGFGSGRWSDLERRMKTVDFCKSIDVTWLKNNDFFAPIKLGGMAWKNRYGRILGSVGLVMLTSEQGRKYLCFNYTQTSSDGTKTEYKYEVALDATPCYFGGKRYWFLCPLIVDGQPCSRRVAKLYLPNNATYFGCRHCYGLTYNSCLNSHKGNVRPDADADIDKLSINQLLRLGDMED
jgi:hypothetical protein